MPELRAQERQPCLWDEPPCTVSRNFHEKRCKGCERDGTRWATVGRLVPDEDTDFSYTIEADA